MSITVVIVDDHPIVRSGLSSLLSQYEDIAVIGEGEGGKAALDLIQALQPDVVLMDIVLIGQDGLTLTRQLQTLGCNSRVIILTSYDKEVYVRQALQAGVHGYLLKSAAAERLADTIRAVHMGEVHICTSLAAEVFDEHGVLAVMGVQRDFNLSDQEMKVLNLMAEGATTDEMATYLYLSQRTIKRRIKDIRNKLEANTRAEVIAKAHELGLL
jgi:DNA-binding NarL/FixJ family response regulator